MTPLRRAAKGKYRGPKRFRTTETDHPRPRGNMPPRDSRHTDDDDDDDAGDAFEETEPQMDTSMKQVRALPLLGGHHHTNHAKVPSYPNVFSTVTGDRRRRPSRCAGRKAREADQRHSQVLLAGAILCSSDAVEMFTLASRPVPTSRSLRAARSQVGTIVENGLEMPKGENGMSLG